MPTDSVMPIVGTRRLVTRSDFDGLVCAALLQELGILEDIPEEEPAAASSAPAGATK